MKNYKIILMLLLILGGFSCHRQDTSDMKVAQENEKILQEANTQVGLPAIVNFEEKRIAKMIMELRDKRNYDTYTYLVDMNNRLRLLCKSVGYGLPFSVQYTSPEKVSWIGKFTNGHWGKLPQGEPNGLFMPTSSDASWVICSYKGKLKVVYTEPKIIVTSFPLQ